MTLYGQFCPVSKAMEIIGEKWTLLILREMLMGTSRFSDFQRALAHISPTLLSRRLKQLEEQGMVIRKRISGREGYEYRLTAMGKELFPVVEQVGVWGMRWARGQMSDDELDVDLLMWDVRRRLLFEHLPTGETVLCFCFKDLEKKSGKKGANFWFIIDGEEVDICTADTGKEVDLYITTDVRTMVEIWEGDRDLSAEIKNGAVTLIGDHRLALGIKQWLGLSVFAGIRPAVEIDTDAHPT